MSLTVPMGTPSPKSVVAPTGLVSIVFTDIQGSTGLWEKKPGAMREGLELHNRVLRENLGALGGYEVKTEGDAFMIAFADPLAAVQLCLAVQEALVQAPWPEELLETELTREERSPDGRPLWRGLRVRMGIHLGEPDCRVDPTTGRMDYFGPVVNRAARVSAAAHGGQVLVSEAVWRQVEGPLARLPLAQAIDAGQHRLKDLEYAERLYQLIPRGLEGRTFPPLRTLDSRKTNLTPHPSPFVGRESDLASVQALFARGERLVTLMGPGGTGKTRLSMRYAALHLDEFTRDGGGGAWFCDLTEARVLESVCAVVGQVLSVPLTSGKTSEDLVAQLGHAIAGRSRVLLVMDNFEQVAACAPGTIGQWMVQAPEARFLVSSQERLRLSGEVAYELKPLSLPDGTSDPEASEAVKLFLQRARAVRRDFTLTPQELPSVVEICRQLDGIPLAIELAAARVGVLSPAKILERLPRRFELLGGARRDVTSRQHTLRGAIDWSWDLLQQHEKDALAQCSVFAGGFSLESAEEVLDLSGHPAAPWPLDVVQALKDKSLLRAWEPAEFPGEVRFGMYSNIREYAAEKLRESGQGPGTVQRHAGHYLRQGESLAEEVNRRGGVERLKRLRIEYENLVAVFERARAIQPSTREAASDAIRAIAALDPVLTNSGPFGSHESWLDQVVELGKTAAVDGSLLATVLRLRGRVRRFRGKPQEALSDLSEAEALFRRAGDLRHAALAFSETAMAHQSMGDLKRAREILEISISEAKKLGDRWAEAMNLGTLGTVEIDAGPGSLTRTHLEQALSLHREVGNRLFEGVVLANLGLLESQSGNLAASIGYSERALAIYREMGSKRFEGNTLTRLGTACRDLGRADESRRYYEQAIAIHREVGNRRSLGITRANLGLLEQLQAHPEEAAREYREAIHLLQEVGDRRTEALFTGYLAALEASTGHADEGARLLADARGKLDDADAVYRAVLEMLESVVELGRIEESGQRERRGASLTRARERLEAGDRTGDALRNEDVRMAQTLVQAAMRRFQAE